MLQMQDWLLLSADTRKFFEYVLRLRIFANSLAQKLNNNPQVLELQQYFSNLQVLFVEPPMVALGELDEISTLPATDLAVLADNMQRLIATTQAIISAALLADHPLAVNDAKYLNGVFVAFKNRADVMQQTLNVA
jgi:hypothetical protein